MRNHERPHALCPELEAQPRDRGPLVSYGLLGSDARTIADQFREQVKHNSSTRVGERILHFDPVCVCPVEPSRPVSAQSVPRHARRSTVSAWRTERFARDSGGFKGARMRAGVPPSDAKDRDSWSQGVGDRLEVVLVGREDSEPTPMSSRDDVDIDDIGRARSPGERADVVCFVRAERHDVAAPQKAPQLSLSA